MTQIELLDTIRAEIERQSKSIEDATGDFAEGRRLEQRIILAFLDTLQEPKKRNALFDKCVENCDPATMKEVSDKVDKILQEPENTPSWKKIHVYEEPIEEGDMEKTLLDLSAGKGEKRTKIAIPDRVVNALQEPSTIEQKDRIDEGFTKFMMQEPEVGLENEIERRIMKDYPYVPGWRQNKENNKPAIKRSVLMFTTHGVAEGEWDGEQWIQYRWSCKVKDSDVLYWLHLADLQTLEKEGESVQETEVEGLEEEIREYMSNDDNNPFDWDWRDKRDCARHFAEWGAKNAK